MKDIFIPTRNYQRSEELCNDLLDISVGIEMAAIIGPYGRGKSTVAEKIYTMNPKTVYVCFEPRFSLVALIREIAFVLGETRPRGTDACIEIIKNSMEQNRRIIMVDEADQMSLKQLNQLRSFHDLQHIPVLLIGQDNLLSKLSREGRLIDRVRTVIKFETVTQADVVVFYRKALDQAIDTENAGMLLRHSKGNFRSVMKDALKVERYMQASGIKQVSKDIVIKVCEEDDKRG